MLYESVLMLDDGSGDVDSYLPCYPEASQTKFVEYIIGRAVVPGGFRLAYTKILDLTTKLYRYRFSQAMTLTTNYILWGVPLAYIDPDVTYDTNVFPLPASLNTALLLRAQQLLLSTTPEADVSQISSLLGAELGTIDILVKSNAGAERITLPHDKGY